MRRWRCNLNEIGTNKDDDLKNENLDVLEDNLDLIFEIFKSVDPLIGII